MEVYTTEQEQIAQLKRWLKSYVPPVVIGVAIALAIGFGWRYFHARNVKASEDASIAYVNMMGAAMSKETAEAKVIANHLVDNYGSTAYGKLAGLMLAKFAAEKGDLKTAQKQLTWVMNNASFSAIKQTARLRLAQVYIAENNPKQALTLLGTIDDKAYLGTINAAKGDAYAALKQPQKAKEAYTLALKQLPPNSDPMLTVKIANVH